MIKANELRVWNWVSHGINYKILAIDGNNECNVDIYVNESEGYKTVALDLIYPIPLTPELLEKCGFECHAEYDVPEWRHESGVYLFEYDGKFNMPVAIVGLEIEIKSLHQLQNHIFALTGEELKIDL